MTDPPEASFPGSRVLADWWRELESFRPRSLWIAHVVLHRIEGLVSSVVPVRLGRVEALLLRFLQSAAESNTAPQWERLSVNSALLQHMAHRLAAEGLVVRPTNETWKLTPEGLKALVEQKWQRFREERRVFTFLSTSDGEATHYIRLLSEPQPQVAPDLSEPRFSPTHYHDCFGKPAEWKSRFGFPDHVRPVLRLDTPDLDWRSLVVDHASRAALALLRTREGTGEGGLLGFWTATGDWVLRSAGPAFRLAEGWRDVFPTLASDPDLNEWRRSWQAWCQVRGLPSPDVERCELEVDDCRLVVHAPRRLLERLQALRSDALKGKAWLVAGEGFVRRAVFLEVTDASTRERSVPGPTWKR
jgi:hypothetical protein